MNPRLANWLKSIWPPRGGLTRADRPEQAAAATTGGWQRINGELVFLETVPLTQQEWLHPLNLIRVELGDSGNVEQMPHIDTWDTPTRAVLTRSADRA